MTGSGRPGASAGRAPTPGAARAARAGYAWCAGAL